jgi:hypothetical protein
MGALNLQLASHDVSHKGERTQISGPSGPAAFSTHSWAAHGPLSLDFTGPNRTRLLLKPTGLPAARAAGAIDLLPRRWSWLKGGAFKTTFEPALWEVEARTSAKQRPRRSSGPQKMR